jgi:hypothetical protein
MYARAKAALFFLLAACSVGEVPIEGAPDGGGGNNAAANEQSFTTIIKPLVGACIGCHGTTLAPVLTSFSTLGPAYKVKPGAQNILVTKGGLTNTHQSLPYLTTAEQGVVAKWIDELLP